ncbi:MAG: murein biosynthesis integral membrane protein MurJ [Acidobacteriota bacterium]|nr:MAG: murein biosynthesis integral membrane protein MurJ [Acidobacteriota bacterium]
MSREPSIARAAGAVSVATGMSRVLGLAREMTIAALFPRPATDAFIAAFKIPNLLRDLLAEGALSAAFVPVFSRVLEKDGRQRAFRLASSVINGLLVVTGMFALTVIVFARFYALSVASGFAEDKLLLTAMLARVMSPFLVTVSIAAVLMGIGNVRGRFFVPALAPALFNVGVLSGGWLLAPWLERNGWPSVTGLAVGAVLGGLLQLAVQSPGVWRDGYRHRWVLDLSDPAVRQILVRLGPAAFGVAATYLNVVVDNQLASYYGQGPVSYLFFAIRLWMLPIGLFGVAISTANLAGVARDLARGDRDRFRRTLATSIRLTLLLTVPAATALIVLGRPIVRVIYEHGQFTPEATQATAIVLALYAVGLPGYALVKVFVPTFYALGDPWTPVRISAAVVLAKIGLNFLLIWPLGYPGLALATGVAAWLNAAWTARRLRQLGGRLVGQQLARAAAMAIVSSVLMAAATVATGRGLSWLWPADGWLAAAVILALQIVVGLLVVAVVVRFSGLPEATSLTRLHTARTHRTDRRDDLR